MSHNPEVAGSNPAPATNFRRSRPFPDGGEGLLRAGRCSKTCSRNNAACRLAARRGRRGDTGMRQPGRGGRCRRRSLGASPRGPIGTYQSLPVRTGLARARVAAAELPWAAGHLFAASGYQECEDQPLLEQQRRGQRGAGAAAYSSRALHSVADLPAACCACNRRSVRERRRRSGPPVPHRRIDL